MMYKHIMANPRQHASIIGYMVPHDGYSMSSRISNHILEHMIVRELENSDVGRQCQFEGCKLGGISGMEYTLFYNKVHWRNSTIAAEVMKQIPILEPSRKMFQKVVEEVENEIEVKIAKQDIYAKQMFESMYFGESYEYGRQKQLLKSVQYEDILQHHNRNYQEERIIHVEINGGSDCNTFIEDHPYHNRCAYARREMSEDFVFAPTSRGLSSVCIGFNSESITSSFKPHSVILAYMLGGSSGNCALNMLLRGEKCYSYKYGIANHYYAAYGLIYAHIFTSTDKIEDVLTGVADLFTGIQKYVNEKSFEYARNQICTELVFSHEMLSVRMHEYARDLCFWGRAREIEAKLTEIKSVSYEDFLSYLNERVIGERVKLALHSTVESEKYLAKYSNLRIHD